MNQHEAMERIEKAVREVATELDLDDLGLTELPPQIGQLTSLKNLNLSKNLLTVLPPEITQLTSLEQLCGHPDTRR